MIWSPVGDLSSSNTNNDRRNNTSNSDNDTTNSNSNCTEGFSPGIRRWRPSKVGAPTDEISHALTAGVSDKVDMCMYVCTYMYIYVYIYIYICIVSL